MLAKYISLVTATLLIVYFGECERLQPSVTQPKMQNVITPSPTFPVNRRVSSEAMPAIGWKIYSNQQYGFVIEYPVSWHLIFLTR